MEVLYLLIPLSLALVLVIAAVLWFAVRSGQFDDLDRPDLDLLADDDAADAGQSRIRPGSRELRLIHVNGGIDAAPSIGLSTSTSADRADKGVIGGQRNKGSTA